LNRKRIWALARALARLTSQQLARLRVPTRVTENYVDLLLARFDIAYRANDLPEAIDLFNRLADHRYVKATSSRGFDRSRRSVVSTFQPKSGGTFLHNRMLEAGYAEYWWNLPDFRCHSWCYPSTVALPNYLAGGCTSHSHFLPHDSVIEQLRFHGVEKIWVHLRHPAESAVSAYYHYQGCGHGEGKVGKQRREQALLEADRNGLPPAQSISEFVTTQIDWYISWTESWLAFADLNPGFVRFSYFEELTDTRALLQRVFASFDVSSPRKISTTPKSIDRFRKKIATDWRSQIKPDAAESVADQVSVRLRPFSQGLRLCA